MARKKFRIPGLSFSWKRALGITALKQRIARSTGIPTTREGRRRKFGPFGLWLLLGGRRTSGPAATELPDANEASAVGCIGALLAFFVGVPLVLLCGCGGLLGLSAFLAPSSSNPATASAAKAPVVTSQPQPVAATLDAAFEPKNPAATAPQEATATPAPPAASTPTAETPLPESTPHPAAMARHRTWTSADGKFSTEAEFLSLTAGVVKLKKADGSVVSVPVEKLSEDDQQFIEEYRKARKR